MAAFFWEAKRGGGIPLGEKIGYFISKLKDRKSQDEMIQYIELLKGLQSWEVARCT